MANEVNEEGCSLKDLVASNHKTVIETKDNNEGQSHKKEGEEDPILVGRQIIIVGNM